MLFFLTTALAFGWPGHFANAIGVEQSIYGGLTGDKPADRAVKGAPGLSHVSGNDCSSNGPPVPLTVIASPGWKLVSGTAHFVADSPPIRAVPSPLTGGIADPSNRQYSATFQAIRADGGICAAGEVRGHLEATETWDGG